MLTWISVRRSRSKARISVINGQSGDEVMSVRSAGRQFWVNPLICGERGATGESWDGTNWNLDTTSEIWWSSLSALVFTQPASTLSPRLSGKSFLFFSFPFLFFLIRWDFIGPPLSVTAIGCEISEGKACGNHSISCAHLALHLYRRAGGFWKGEKSFTKSVSEAGFNTNRLEIFHTMFSRFLLDLRLFSLLVKPLSDCTGSLRDGITALKKKQYLGKESLLWMNSMSGKEKMCNAAVCRLRNPHQSGHSWPWMQTLEGWKKKKEKNWSWMTPFTWGPTLCAL